MTLLRQLIIHKFISLITLLSLAACSFSNKSPDSGIPHGLAASYFVDIQNGSDSNPGTSREKPWRTIQKAADLAQPGDTVSVLPGIYPERVKIIQAGSEGSPIVFQALGSVTTRGFTILAPYITLRGFSITDTPDNAENGWGIYVSSHHCIIENNSIDYATRGGILLWARPGEETNTANCVIRNNSLSRNAMVGIEINGRNHLVEGNDISGSIQYHPAWKNPPVYVDADGIRFFGSGHTIRNNHIHDILYGIPENPTPHIDCFQTWAGQDREPATNIIIEQNLCENIQVQTPNQAGQGFMLEGANNLVIRNNILKAFRPINAVSSLNLTIVNNVLISSPAVSYADQTSGVSLSNTKYSVIKNNIFYGIPGPTIFTSDAISKSSLDAGFNLAYVKDGVKPSGTPHPGDLWNVDPLFKDPAANDFHLESNSPAIDAGTNIPSLGLDMDGNPRPQGTTTDIGAFEVKQYRSLIPLIDQLQSQWSKLFPN